MLGNSRKKISLFPGFFSLDLIQLFNRRSLLLLVSRTATRFLSLWFYILLNVELWFWCPLQISVFYVPGDSHECQVNIQSTLCTCFHKCYIMILGKFFPLFPANNSLFVQISLVVAKTCFKKLTKQILKKTHHWYYDFKNRP